MNIEAEARLMNYMYFMIAAFVFGLLCYLYYIASSKFGLIVDNIISILIFLYILGFVILNNIYEFIPIAIFAALLWQLVARTNWPLDFKRRRKSNGE
jgi:predicted membrane protein